MRYAPEYRSDAQSLGNVLIATPSGQQLPLAQVVTIDQTRGPAMINSENGLLLATVLLDVQGRDVGGFVEEAKAAVASRVSLPQGYFIGWSGRYESQERARQRLQVVVPIAILVIFVLLYFTYHSALQAAQVLLTVPFALTGGVYLLWLLGYNFSVAVWVGFIALFGTAVQTGVVMVIYLDEALQRKAVELGGRLTRRDLRDAVVEGALLRLRPKVMTVSTVVAGLLPIMWSSRVGAEIMKPLATPVLGGMVSSLLYVLIVTPVLFYWIHERRLRLASGQTEPVVSGAGRTEFRSRGNRLGAAVVVVVLVGSTMAAGWWLWDRSRAARQAQEAGAVLQTVRTGDLAITLSNAAGQLRQGSNHFRIEFRSAQTNELVDAGAVQLGAAMTMPGMAMTGTVFVAPAGRPGVYEAKGDFSMAGSWRMTIEWNGPAGRGSAFFEGDVR